MIRRRFVIGLLAAAGLAGAVAGRAALLRAAGGPDPADTPAERRFVASLHAAGARLKPLHAAKTPPKPGEWLDKHPEAGQTFDRYRVDDPNRPTARRTTIYVQPLGRFTPAEQRLMDATAELLGVWYAVPVKTLPALGLDVVPDSARRVHPTWGDRQVLTTFVLNLLRKRRPDDAVAVLALTTSDLWPGEGWNFVYGQASLNDRVGVWSIYRDGNPDREFPVCLRRTLGTAVHETGHMLSIPHCIAYECAMNGSNHREEADSRPLWFCPEDEMKVWWATRCDPAARFDRLAAFGDRHGLTAEAAFWRKSREALGGKAGRR